MPSPRFTLGNPGKPKGAVNKSTKLVKEVFADVFSNLQNDPKVNLKAWGKANPTEFYKLAARLIPTEVEGLDTKVKITVTSRKTSESTK